MYRQAISLALFAFLAVTAGAGPAYDITGTVVDAAGKGVPEAKVWIVQNHIPRAATCDAGGAFAFSGVLPGLTVLAAWKEGFSVGGFNTQIIGPMSSQIMLAEPEDQSIRVIDFEFAPVEGAWLSSLVINDSIFLPVDEMAPLGFPSRRSDGDGKLMIPALPRGCVIGIVAAHRDHTSTFLPYLPVDDKNAAIQLDPGEKIGGRVTNEQGLGVPNAAVLIARAKPDRRHVPVQAVTDKEGFYAAVTPPASYLAVARHPDYAPSRPVEAAVTRETENVANIVLPVPHNVRGSVLNPEGQPFSGVWAAYLEGESIHQQGLTQADGSFELKVAKGEGKIRVMPPDGFTVGDQLDIIVQTGDAPESQLLPITLKHIPEVTGTITGPDGQPVTEAIIASANLDPPIWVLAAKDGTFKFHINRMPPGGLAAFHVEHPKHFWRGDFAANLINTEPIVIALSAYEPMPAPNDHAGAPNDLESFVGKPAPELQAAEWLNADPAPLSSLKGKVAVIVFWGGFALEGSAFNQMEEIRATADLYKDDPEVRFIGVHDSSVTVEEAKGYVRDFQIMFPTAYDKEGADTFIAYGAKVIPQAVLVDRKGMVRYYDTRDRMPELIKMLRREAG